MTLRTTSATRRTVVSRSSDVASTSATSSSSDSTGKRSDLESTEPIVRMIAAAFPCYAEAIAARKGVSILGALLFFRQLFSGELFSRYYANVGQVAILLRVVEPETNHKLVGNLKSDVISFQRKLAPRRLVEQRRNFQRPRLTGH